MALNDIEAVERASKADLDAVAVTEWLSRVRDRSAGRTQTLDDRDILRNRGVIAENLDASALSSHTSASSPSSSSHPTLAGLMAFGSNPQRFFPRLGVVVTVHPTNVKSAAGQIERFVDRVTVDGSIPEMIVATVRTLSRNMRHSARIEGVLREDVPEYPLNAIREAVANALIHRDYSPDSWGAPVTVELYPSRLEISNPGGLFGSVTVEELMHASATQSRNQYLSRILEDVVYRGTDGAGSVVENAGSGIPLIRNELAENGLEPPCIKSTLSRFTITFLSTPPDRTTTAQLNEDERRVVEAIAQLERATTKAIATAAGLSAQTVRRVLNHLMEREIVEGIGKPKSPKRSYQLREDTSMLD